MIKRVLSFILCFCLLFAVVACQDGSYQVDVGGDTAAQDTTSDTGGNGGSGGSSNGGSQGSGGTVQNKPFVPNRSGVIKIGMSAPITGAASAYGMITSNAAKMAVDEINAAGGIYGMTVELYVADDAHDASKIQSNYNYFKEQGVQVSLGAVTSLPCIEFARLAKNDNLFFLTPTASGDVITESSNAYQMCFSDSRQGAAAAQFFNKNCKDKKIGLLYQADQQYSTDIRAKFIEALDPSLKSNSLVEAFLFEGTGDLSNQISILSDCDVIYMPMFYTSAAKFILQAKSTISEDVIYYGSDGIDGIEYALGLDLDKIPQEIVMFSQFDFAATQGPAADFMKSYIQRYGEVKSEYANTIFQFGACAYDAVYAIADALKVALENGKNVTSYTSASEMCEILKGVFNSGAFEFRGITGACVDGERSHVRWNADGTVIKDVVAVSYSKGAKHE